jgi:DNA-directed RNA polymerase specialized sigma24 family protein
MGAALQQETLADSFTQWAEEAEPRLRHALTASFGMQVGTEAAADALAHVWLLWGQINSKENLLGYAYGIGRNKARRMVSPRRRPTFVEVAPQRLPHVEPALPAAIARLPEKQRIAVTLLYGYEWSMSEVADLLGTTKTTVQNHAERGLARLRKTLGVDL